MKSIKYLALALIFGAGLVACGEPVGTPGNTTVEFAVPVLESGFGAGYVYVPLVITADNEADLNTADVKAKVKIVETGAAYEGKHDETGLPNEDGVMGDYRVTSFDINFPDYESYKVKDEEENKKLYYNEDTKKWQKKVQMEVKILNTNVDELRFTFQIESATTTIGAVNTCEVVLAKTAVDRRCGTFKVESDGSVFAAFSSFTTSISWNSEYGCFEILPWEDWAYSPVYAYWEAETEKVYMLPYEPLMWYDSASMMMCYQMFFTVEGNSIVPCTEEKIYIDYDLETGVYTFPADLSFAVLVYGCDAGYNPNSLVGYFTSGAYGITMTKQ
ncbi:MAG: hypothetical protein J6V28_04875 [Tidjanibacter sp.]|nr:hypothetical protein [Tidjanibacter sp.]